MIQLTEPAANWIQRAINNRVGTKGIRFGVRTTGCSGLAYVVEFVDHADVIADDTFESRDVSIFIDKKSQVYLSGMTVDFATEGLNSGLKFLNPNEAAQCGCGESFTV